MQRRTFANGSGEWGKRRNGWGMIIGIVVLTCIGVILSAQSAMALDPAMVTEASYIICQENQGGTITFYARNGLTGAADYSGNDAATVINSALGGLTSGGKLFIKAGEYPLSSTIGGTLKKRLLICGEGYQTKLIAANGLNANILYFNNLEDTIFENFLIDGKRDYQSSSSTGIRILNARNVEIRKLYIKNMYSDGIFCDGTYADGMYNVKFDGVTITNCGGNGIIFAANDYGYGHDIFVSNSYLYSNGQNSSSTSGIYAGCRVNRVTIANNIIRDQATEHDTTAGIRVNVGLNSLNPQIVVSGNISENIAGCGILVQNVRGAIVVGNTSHNCARAGLYIELSPSTCITGNILTNNDAYGLAIAWYDGIYSHETKVTNNYIANNNANGIYCDSNYVTIQGNTVKNNNQTASLYDYRTAGILAWGQYNFVSGNLVFDDQEVKTQKYGISDYNSAGNRGSNNTFIDNDVRGNAIAGLYMGGTNEKVKGNSGFVTEKNGVASVANNGTIAHGLVGSPSMYNVTATIPGHIAVVTSVDATNMTIGLYKPGTGDTDIESVTTPEGISWYAEYHP